MATSTGLKRTAWKTLRVSLGYSMFFFFTYFQQASSSMANVLRHMHGKVCVLVEELERNLKIGHLFRTAQ